MDEQRQDDQREPIYNNAVPIQEVALKTYRERWMIEAGGGRESGRSVLVVRHDDKYNWKKNSTDHIYQPLRSGMI